MYKPSDTVLRLQVLKSRVRIAMDTLGEAAWRQTVHQVIPNWTGVRANPASRAYYKMFEMIKTCALKDVHKSAHLAEAPGGFVQACIDLFPELDWRVQSLASGIKIHPSLKSGVVSTADGDLLNPDSRNAIVDAFLSSGKYDLVTADGAAEMDHSRLEESAIPLLRAEVDTAMRILSEGGTFVVKVFELASFDTLQVVASLCGRFRSVTLIKPTLSRPTNSERYLVCVDFRPSAPVETAITDGWLKTVQTAADAICATQCGALEASLLDTRIPAKRRRAS